MHSVVTIRSFPQVGINGVTAQRQDALQLRQFSAGHGTTGTGQKPLLHRFEVSRGVLFAVSFNVSAIPGYGRPTPAHIITWGPSFPTRRWPNCTSSPQYATRRIMSTPITIWDNYTGKLVSRSILEIRSISFTYSTPSLQINP